MLTEIQRAALLEARWIIASGERNRICWALNLVIIRNPSARVEKDIYTLKRYIMEKLGRNNPSLEYWQEQHGIYHTPEQCREDRLNWIDWMLGEL